MRTVERAERTSTLLEQLVEVWEASVRATHLFLSDTEILNIKQYVPEVILAVSHLVIEERPDGRPIAFMGTEDGRLEMLFLAPEERGHVLGRRLVEYGIQNDSVREVTVNEQNPLARGFYEHIGFEVYKRTDRDEEGTPYPLLYMKLGHS